MRRIGLHHVCFRARSPEDIDTLHAFLVSRSVRVFIRPSMDPAAPGYYSVLFEDPEGIRLEVNFVPGKGHFEHPEQLPLKTMPGYEDNRPDQRRNNDEQAPDYDCRIHPGRPERGQPHLRRLYAILKSVAPEAEEAVKWGTPFFVEPRFLFSFSAAQGTLQFRADAAALEPFRKELAQHKTTKNFLQVPYIEPLPEDLIRRIAEYCVRHVHERESDSFW
jgi:uncharacterized protein YdhG (YjbR/CyaY superfamily)